MRITQVCCVLFWTNPGNSTPQNSSYTDTHLPSHKPSKLDKQYMLGTAGKVGMNSCDILPSTSTHRYNSVGRPAKTYIHQPCVDTGCCVDDLLWLIGMNGKRESREFVLSKWFDYDIIYILLKFSWYSSGKNITL